MKRLGAMLLIPFLILFLFTPALAADSAQHIESNATMASDGSCRVQLRLRLQLDQPVQALTLPLPASARDIFVNHQPVTGQKEAQRVVVQLPSLSVGVHDLQVEYTLQGLVNLKTGELTLPLLSGFALPIQEMEFSLMLPGNITGKPQFTSGYHQQLIQNQIATSISGNTLTGKLQTALKDHETLVLTMDVDPALFTQAKQPLIHIERWSLVIWGCVLVAIGYFLLTLLPRYPRIRRCSSPPEGISAGEVGTCLTGCGTDLTLLVLTWAQLGYLTLQPDARGRVLLHKRMSMGNERSAAENRWFLQLFGAKTTIDGTGMHYAQLCRKVAAKAPLLQLMFARRSGNRWVFRALCCLAGLLGGVRLGLELANNTGGQVVLAMLLGGGMALLSYWIQSGGKCLPLRDKTPLLIALGCGAAWLLLGLLTHHLGTTLCMVLFQFLAGICAAYGGKRSELGKRSMANLLGLRSHMVGTKAFDLQQLMRKNPNYFYELAPYALAMGVDRKFARHFGKEPLPEDSYLDLGHHHGLTAAQWAAQLRRTVDLLNKRQKRLPLERLIGK